MHMRGLFIWKMIGPVSLLTLTLAGFAQDKPVTFDMAFNDAEPELRQRSPFFFMRWLDDEHFLLPETQADGKRVYYRVNAPTGKKTPYDVASEGVNIRNEAYQLSADNTGELWLEDGDIMYLDRNTETKRQLTRSLSAERNPTFSPNGRKIAFTRDHNLFVIDIDSGLETQLTGDGSETVYNGWASWVYYEEILGRSSRYRAFWWSPDSENLLYMRFDDSPVKVFSIYHEEGNYGHIERMRYPKAGETNPYVRMGVVSSSGGDTTWLDFDEKADHYIAWPFWMPDGKTIHVQWMNRDQNHLIIYACDAKDGSKKAVYEETQPTWVEFFDDITYVENGFILRSDKDGRRHLYLHHLDGSLKRRLTQGDWSVSGIVGVDEQRNRVFFTGNPRSSLTTDLMAVNLDEGDMTIISDFDGSQRFKVSPDFNYYLTEVENHLTPEQIHLYRTNGEKLTPLFDAANSAAAAYQKGRSEFFTIPTPDGLELPAVWLLPPDLDTSGQTKYGIIFRIYSGPYHNMVANNFRWSWRDHYYAANGVITISVDHRGSAHFGKEGTNNMYRRMGHWEVIDLVTAVKWLREKPFIDPERVGITGHSYGGYMTLLALTKGAGYFTHGVSGAPVSDWSLYDTVYTERYMDRPQDNPDGYKDGSVLTHAHKLAGKLRLLHGTIDDNVHLQNSLQVVDILTNENIQFEFMVYPGSRHGIRQRKHRNDAENTFWFQHFLNRIFEPGQSVEDHSGHHH